MDDFREEQTLTADINTCDLEPIHTPGRIQPFGVLLAGPTNLSKVMHCSRNLDELTGASAEDMIGAPFSALFSPQALHDIRNSISASTARTQRERVGVYDVLGRAHHVYAHINPQNLAVIELEPKSEGDQSTYPVDEMRKLLAAAQAGKTIDKLLRLSVLGLQALTGYDRVMAYRYFPNGDGEVVAEAVVDGIDRFLGLRYPAWDVPEQARALQVRNPLRMLIDVHQNPVPMLSEAMSESPVDMSLAHLRGISPIHVQYLSNMGVSATLTVGIVVDGRLWGMFAFHHYAPRTITADLRIAVELYGQMASLLIKEKLEAELVTGRQKTALARQRVLSETSVTTDLLNSFPKLAPILSEIIASDGLAVTFEGKTLTYGTTPTPEAINCFETIKAGQEDIIQPFDTMSRSDLWHADNLQKTAGALLVRATAAYPMQVIYFRNEITQSLLWAGKPEKEMEDGPLGPRISPRQSFDSYVAQQKGYCNPWSAADLAAAKELQTLLTQIVAKGERVQLERHKDISSYQRQQDLMIAELNHRVKNILALIKSLSKQAKDSSASLESYALALEQRIAALAAAHDLAVSNTMQGVSLRGIVQTELAPYLGDSDSQILMNGPLVGLRADIAPMVALVLHEIVSNAAKYGALSTKDGLAKVKWHHPDRGGLAFEWREVGGPPVKEPTRHGFGRSLIEKAIPFELDGEAHLEFAPGGVKFSFWVPEDALVEVSEETGAPQLKPRIPVIARIGEGKRACVVEDNVVLAMDMVDTLTRLGTESIKTGASIEQAMELLEHSEFDFGVLDMNLRGIVSMDVADRFKDLGIPFVFVTGYGSKIDVPSRLSDVPILTKPIDEGTLSRTIEALLER